MTPPAGGAGTKRAHSGLPAHLPAMPPLPAPPPPRGRPRAVQAQLGAAGSLPVGCRHRAARAAAAAAWSAGQQQQQQHHQQKPKQQQQQQRSRRSHAAAAAAGAAIDLVAGAAGGRRSRRLGRGAGRPRAAAGRVAADVLAAPAVGALREGQWNHHIHPQCRPEQGGCRGRRVVAHRQAQYLLQEVRAEASVAWK